MSGPMTKKTKNVVLLGVLAVLALVFVYVYFLRGGGPAAAPITPESEQAATELTRKIQEANKNVPLPPPPSQPVVPGSGHKVFGGGK
jgi:hypothetical protein